MIGDAAQGHLIARALVTRGEGDIKHPRCSDRIFEKHLIEIPQPEKQDGVFVLGFDIEVLPHHRRKVGHKNSRGRQS